MPTSLRPDHETLLAHTAWVRALAQRLVRDPERADDLVQETWLAAMTRPPTDRTNPRGWLRAVLRNVFRQDRRAEARRLERERDVARPECQESEVLGRARTHRDLVDVLTELDEPFRTTLLLRYFDDLGIDAIAARLEVPRDTVRSRLRRGLERMRARLDSQHDGDRSAWLSALVPLALGPVAPPPVPVTPPGLGLGLGALAVNAKLKIAAACALALGGTWILTSQLASPEAAEPAALRAAAKGPSVAPPGEAPPAPAQPDLRRAVDETAAGAVNDATTLAAEVVARLVGQVVDVRARPMAGFSLVVTAGPQRALVRSGPDGRFDLAAPLSAAVIRSADEHFATVLSARHEPGTSVEHVVVVAPAIALAGSVVDEAGRPLAGARVELVVPRDLQRSITRVLAFSSEETFAVRSAADGTFSLAGAPGVEGSTLTAALDGYAPHEDRAPLQSDPALHLVLSRASVEVGAIAGRVVDADGAPLEGAHVAAGWATTRTDSAGQFAFELEVSREAEELVAVYPGHLPARLEAVTSDAGSLWPDYVVLRMEQEALSIAGQVVDESGTPRANVRVWAADPTFFGSVDEVLTQVESHLAGAPGWTELEERGADLSKTPNAFWSWAETDADGRFRLTGLLPREYRLKTMDTVSCVHAVSDPVQAGATGVELTLPALHAVRTVAGIVQTPDGYAVPEARVRLFHRAVKRQQGETTVSWDVTGPETTTDEAGRFSIEDVPAAGMRLLVSGDGIRTLTLAAEELVEADELVLHVELAEDRCYLVVETADASFADRFELHESGGRAVPLEFRRGGHATTTDSSHIVDGRSFVLAVPEGAYELVLFLDDVEVERRPVHLKPGPVNVLR
jgi:RNA polymerase sigma-70 factor (ECF subfamily)